MPRFEMLNDNSPATLVKPAENCGARTPLAPLAAQRSRDCMRMRRRKRRLLDASHPGNAFRKSACTTSATRVLAAASMRSPFSAVASSQ